MFTGREKELRRLNDLKNKQVASLVVMMGRRRIGKSCLLKEYAKTFKKSFIFTGITPEPGITNQDQKNEFAKTLAQYFSWPEFSKDNWRDLFSLLAEQSKKGEVCIVLDEISWMAKDDPLFLPQLKNAWDLEFKNNSKLILVLCGSISSWIQGNILSSTGFIGRISDTIRLKELSLEATMKFWDKQEKNLSSIEKLKFLNIVGGVPRYLEELDNTVSTEQNILRLAFREGGFLFAEFERLFSDLFSEKNPTYQRILSKLTNVPKTFSEISANLNRISGGSLTNALDDILQAGFIRRNFNWSLISGDTSKISKYTISDNYCRFYLKYIKPNQQKIIDNIFPDKDLQFLPGWESIMGFQFENLILNNKDLIYNLLDIDKRDIIADGPYFQTKTQTRNACQIDYLIQTRFNTLYLCEIKCRNSDIGRKIIKETEHKIDTLDISKNFSVRPILISAGDVSEQVTGERYFARVITGDDLLHTQ